MNLNFFSIKLYHSQLSNFSPCDYHLSSLMLQTGNGNIFSLVSILNFYLRSDKWYQPVLMSKYR